MDRRRFSRTLALGTLGTLAMPIWARRGLQAGLLQVSLPEELVHVRHGALDVPVADRSTSAWWRSVRRDVFLADGLTRDPFRDAHLITLVPDGPQVFVQGDDVEIWDGGRPVLTVPDRSWPVSAGPFDLGVVRRTGVLGPFAHARVLVPVRGCVQAEDRPLSGSGGLVLPPGAPVHLQLEKHAVLLAVSRPV